MAEVVLPYKTPLEAKVVAPVPPLDTPRVPVIWEVATTKEEVETLVSLPSASTVKMTA